MTGTDPHSHDFVDLNGRQVHAFASHMANLGFRQLTDLLIAMFKSGAWRRFQDGLGTYEFLPGEFDYFLTQQGVNRDDVMNGVRDIETKAQLEAAMDERRTGEAGYRRRITEVRSSNPERPGRPILPFGYTLSEGKALLSDSGSSRATRKLTPLGPAVRRWIATGGTTTMAPSDQLTRLERSRRLALRLSDDDLAILFDVIKAELKQRRERAP